MRSIKLLAALAVPAMFAACTNEELFKVDNTPQKMEEVVGTKLIGTDVSLNASMNDAETRVDFNTGSWHTDDVLGLAWLCTDDGPESDQLENGTFNREGAHKLYANHMFSYDKEESAFTTKGNIYQGWYFAYYPWGYEPKVAQKVFKVNPEQGAAKEGQSVLSTRKGQNLFISNRRFLSAAQVQDGEFTVPFQVQPVLSNIVVTTKPLATSSFATNEDMKALKIESITINVDKTGKKENGIFAEYLTLNAANIPAWTTTAATGKDVDGTNKDNLLAKLYAETDPVLTVSNETGAEVARAESVTTNVVEAGYTAGAEGNQLITIVAPATAELDVQDIKIEIKAGVGTFVIEYTEAENLTEEQAKNNDAIEKLVERYKATYKDANGVEKAGTLTQAGKWLGLDVILYDDIFVTDFSNIACVKCWDAAVNMVNILGRKAETFTITSAKACAHGGNGVIEFTDGITMPTDETCEITVKRNPNNVQGLTNAYFKISGNLEEWPANLNTSSIKVVNDATISNAHTISAQLLVNNGTLNVPTVGEEGTYENTNELKTSTSTAIAYYGVKNYGTIVLEKWAKVTNVDNSGTPEKPGEIKVVYGSYVELTPNTDDGIISHVVTAEDVAAPVRIVKLISPVTTTTVDGKEMKEWAGVNTLDVNEGIVLDFTKKTEGVDTEAENDPYTPTDKVVGEDSYANFGDMAGVDFRIYGGTIKSTKEDVVVEVNNVYMTNGTVGPNIKINGDLTVTEKGTVTVTSVGGKADVTNCTLTVDEINSGLTANGGTVTAGTIKGGATLTNCTITADKIEGNVTISGTENTLNVAEITGTLIIEEGANATVNGANIGGDVQVKGNNKVTLADINITGALDNKGTTTINGADAAVGSINNSGELTANTDVTTSQITVNKGSKVAVADENTIWYTTPLKDGGYIQNGTTTGNVLYKGADTVLAELKAAIANGGDVTLVADVTLDEALTISNDVTLNLNGKTLAIENSELNYGLINKAKLTIKNGTIDFEGNAANNGAAVINMAQIEMENVTVTSTSATCFRNYGDATDKTLAGKEAEDAVVTAVVSNCNFTSSYQNNESHTYHRYAIHGYGFSNLTMTGCTVEGCGGVSVDASFATLNNVTATAKSSCGTHDLYVAAGVATVTGCTFNNAVAYSDSEWGTAYVNGEPYANGGAITNL